MRILIAGGGTGGHLFPGIAVAEEVIARGGQVLFVGTKRGIEARVVPKAGYPLELIEISGLNRVGAAAFAKGLGRLPVAFGKCFGILRKFRPDVVLGVGGYASGPMVLTAALTGRPSAILEQNSVPGFTNRVLGKFVKKVFTAFDDAAAGFPTRKVMKTGNPVRKSFTDTPMTPVARPGATPSILVLGGSQGARAVSDLVIGAAAVLAKSGRAFHIVHQTGAADEARVGTAYAEAGLATQVTVRPFIDDMVAAYMAADVVIARAGALTLTELAIAGRPAILIPLPTAADDHQNINAAAYAKTGAAVVLAQNATNPGELAALLAALLSDEPRRRAMATAMTGLATPRAAAAVVDELENLVRA